MERVMMERKRNRRMRHGPDGVVQTRCRFFPLFLLGRGTGGLEQA